MTLPQYYYQYFNIFLHPTKRKLTMSWRGLSQQYSIQHGVCDLVDITFSLNAINLGFAIFTENYETLIIDSSPTLIIFCLMLYHNGFKILFKVVVTLL